MSEQPGLMCVHAHADDETIATGGVLARYADEGFRTAVVTCTGGELGAELPPEADTEAEAERLRGIRVGELEKALGILGAGEPRLLGFRDSGMMGEPANTDPRSFWSAPFDDAVRRLVAHVREFRPAVVVTYDAFGGYGHPDHIQAHRVALCAVEAAGVEALYADAGPAWRVRKVYFATFSRTRVVWFAEEFRRRGLVSPFDDGEEALRIGTPDGQITTVVDIGPWMDRKWEALRAHTSQIGPDSYFLNIPEDMREAAFGTEFYVRHRTDVAVPEREDDLFAGLRAPSPAP